MSETAKRADLILPPSARRSLADEVLERLRDAILRGQIEPGEPLQARHLAESMRISPGPVREALRRLEREGLVIMRHSRTPVVAELSRQDLDEVFSLRNALEHVGVQYACRNATPDDWQALQAVIDTLAAYVKRGITEAEAANLDLHFHDLLYQASKHQRLIAFWSDLRPQIHVFLLRRNLADAHFKDVTVSGHQDILEAIKSRDEARAIAVIESHLQNGFDWVVVSLHRRQATDA
jgi:DNA-binding GntR family transcriptional regulator